MELGTLETTLGSVISGLGVAYVPYTAVDNYVMQEQIYCYELPKEYSHITTIFIYRKTDHLTPALRRFLDTIIEINTKVYKKKFFYGVNKMSDYLCKCLNFVIIELETMLHT